MGLQSKNFTALNLSGTMTTAQLGNGVTANTVHQIYCLSGGNISINAMGGGSFIWSATTNTFLDIVPATLTVISGTFVGFKAKEEGISYRTNAF